MVRDDVSEEVVFEGTSEKERSLLGIQEKRIQGRENSKCKGPEGRNKLGEFEEQQGGWYSWRGVSERELWGDETREAGRGQIRWEPVGCGQDSGFDPESKGVAPFRGVVHPSRVCPGCSGCGL